MIKVIQKLIRKITPNSHTRGRIIYILSKHTSTHKETLQKNNSPCSYLEKTLKAKYEMRMDCSRAPNLRKMFKNWKKNPLQKQFSLDGKNIITAYASEHGLGAVVWQSFETKIWKQLSSSVFVEGTKLEQMNPKWLRNATCWLKTRVFQS